MKLAARGSFRSASVMNTSGSKSLANRAGAGLAALFASSVCAGAATLVSGPSTYTQDFNAVGAATTPWADDATVPGWFAGINANNTPDGPLQATDGNDATALSGLLNLGSAGAPERALGSKSTGVGNFANIAYGALFQNVSAQRLIVTSVSYTGELWRTNSTAEPGTAEQWFTSYKTSPVPITDTEPGPSSATPEPGTFIAAPDFNWSSPTNTPPATALDGNDPANRVAISGTLNAVVEAGEYFMFRWVDTNLAGTDGYQGIDEVSITFVPEPGSLSLALAGGLVLLRRRRAPRFGEGCSRGR